MDERDIDLVDYLCSSETEVVEFKKDNSNHKLIAKLCSAISNAACYTGKDNGYVIWGVNDDDSEIIGTNFDYDQKVVGNEVFQFWLAKVLAPSLNFSFKTIEHPKGRIVLLEIPAATITPICFDNIAYIRVGSATPKLNDYPERYKKLIDNMRPYTWEKDVAKKYISEDDVLELLDYPSYFKLTAQRLPDNRNGIFEKLEADQLISKDIGSKWNITNLGAILFANNLDDFSSSIARKAVRFVAYEGNNKASTVQHRLDGKRGYSTGLLGLVTYLNGLLPKNEHIGSAFREEILLYPERAIREIIANALIHQDMTITGAGPSVNLFSDRLEVTNPGKPLVKTDRMIDLPPRSRNEALAALMRRMKLCEEEGSGLDKVVEDAELYQLPPPKFYSETDSMQVILYAPRKFAKMTTEERIRACHQHAVIKFLSGDRMKNSTLCQRFGIEAKNAAQASKVIGLALDKGLIKAADKDHPRAGYIPAWA